jgi:hypothetical protein
MFSISLLRYVTLSKITLIKRGRGIHLPLKILIRARTGAPISLSRHDKGLATIIGKPNNMLLARNWMLMYVARMKTLVVRNRNSGYSTTITPLAEDSKYLKLVARTS